MAYKNLALDRVNLHLGEEFKKKFKLLSKKRGMSMSAMIRFLIQKEYDKDKRKE